ncbi:right-handed parallel beta-helix repeat-containing protein [Streptomyces tropicalis]|uniref:Right-handed parallel beta-helix repeat-containing protein n=1 Tax=Streptomyces tropicalis TaxID=3034234 RepID=A0ABT6A6Z7_9ACTN|nr:right-handed parallel beta-helix repeat-containing protein [Streptomyces tropicalis]MDF3300402.1 right-handed parallel beta-helix repeat-containing protein [Streptomyces tropicalis]
MTKRHTALALCVAALAGSAVAAAPEVAVPRTHVVHPGQSIQRAVDIARSGDTVLVLPGVYHGSVRVTTPRLTLRGAGRRTVVEPGPRNAADRCAKSGNGICVTGTRNRRLTGVTVSDLAVTGFTRAGVFGMATDGLAVRRVTSERNGLWGFAEERSVRSVYRGNTARANGEAGLFLANTITAEKGAYDTGGTLLRQNRLEGNRIGVTIRRLRNVTVSRNVVTGNCAGLFVVGDENKPRAGAVTVRRNRIAANNKYCAKTARLPFLQGSGVVLTGAEDSLVTGNTITGNRGRSPMSGGVVLFKSFVGAPSRGNRVSGNRLTDNAPADLVNQETTKSNNHFQGNSCRASRPAGLC